VTDTPAKDAGSADGDAAPVVTVYSAPWCGPCTRLKQRLRELSVEFQEIDVEEDPEAAEWVISVNRGDRMIPTVRFADGRVLRNPTADEVLAGIHAAH
jgi:mycoredoxin